MPPDFASENLEIRAALAASEQSLAGFAGEKTWVMDTGFDNDAVWWQIWEETQSHLVCRLKHRERIVLWQAPQGTWEERYLQATFRYLKPLAKLKTELMVRLQGQPVLDGQSREAAQPPGGAGASFSRATQNLSPRRPHPH